MAEDWSDEVELLDQALRDDRDAFGILLTRRKRWLEAEAREFFADKPGFTSIDHEDAVQETAKRAWESRKTFITSENPSKRIPPFNGFLRAILHNYCLGQLDSASAKWLRLESFVFGPDDAGLDRAPAGTVTPSRECRHAEAVKQIKRCFDALSVTHQRLLNMWLDDLSRGQMTEQTGMTGEAIGGALKRAKRQLYDCMMSSSRWSIPGR